MERAPRAWKSNPSGHYCALAYRPTHAEGKELPQNIQIVLLAFESSAGNLTLLVSTSLTKIVRVEDRPYFDELFQDLRERTLLDPEALLQQLSSLSVGPLVTHRTGIVSADDQYLTDFCSDFVSL